MSMSAVRTCALLLSLALPSGLLANDTTNLIKDAEFEADDASWKVMAARGPKRQPAESWWYATTTQGAAKLNLQALGASDFNQAIITRKSPELEEKKAYLFAFEVRGTTTDILNVCIGPFIKTKGLTRNQIQAQFILPPTHLTVSPDWTRHEYECFFKEPSPDGLEERIRFQIFNPTDGEIEIRNIQLTTNQL